MIMNNKLVIIGGGPSIKELDFKKLDNQFTFGTNFVCHFYEPTALIWVDREFYDKQKQFIDDKKCIKITRSVCNVPSDIMKLQDSDVFCGGQGLKQGLYSSFLVGLFSLSLGIALDFKEIYLLGYDCGFVNNVSHFHDIPHRGRENERPYTKTYKFKIFSNYKNVFNVSLNSNLDVFPKISYSEFYDRIKDNTVDQIEARQWLTRTIYEKQHE